MATITLNENQFFTNLSNLALIIRLYATNVSPVQKNFVDSFSTETLAFGDTKIFPYSQIPDVGDYSATSTLLQVNKPQVDKATLKISQMKVIRSSFTDYILTMAFTSDSGMNEFTGYLIGQMESAKENYQYNDIITKLFSKVFTATNTNKTIPLINITGAMNATDKINARTLNNEDIAISIQNEIQNMSVFSKLYNEAKYDAQITPDNLKFIYNEPFHSNNIVSLFATLLKSEYIEKSFYKPEMYSIPQIKIPSGQQNVIGWVMHKYAYQWFYKFVFMASFFDMSNLIINNFLHFWFGDGWLPQLPVLKITANYA